MQPNEPEHNDRPTVIFGCPIPSSTNSPSVSELDIVRTDGEILRLARDQARRRGRRARKERLRVHIVDQTARRNELELINLRAERDRLRHAVQELEEEIDQLRAQRQHLPLVQQAMTEDEWQGPSCVMCLGKDPNMVLIPCWHAVLCEECHNQLQRRQRETGEAFNCPYCKTAVVTAVKIFFP